MPISSALGSSALLPAGLGFRNILINGNMRIAQRGTTAVTTTDGFAVDRWKIGIGTTGSWSAQQVTTASFATLSGFDYAYKFTKTTGNTPAAGDYNYFVQGVEGNNIAGLSWGTAVAKPVVLSFWVYSGATGTFGGSIRNPGGPFWAYPFSYTVNTANTWEYKTVSIPGPTSGSFPTDTNAGFALFFDLGSGANARLTAGSWQSGTNCIGASGTSQYPTNTSGGYLHITGVQLEQNYQATPFEQRPYGIELALCQRYYEKTYAIDTTPGTNTAFGIVELAVLCDASGYPLYQQTFQVPKRGTGYTMTFYRYDGTAGSWDLTRYTSATITTNTMTYDNKSERSTRIYTSAATAAAREPCRFQGHWVASAEL